GLGSILGMMFFSGIIGLPFVLTSGERFQRLQSGVKLVAGVLSMGLGVAIMLQIGVGQGLLT
ncbi:MAG: urease accessory protein UreH, partial [Dehalococcoidia bacterium]